MAIQIRMPVGATFRVVRHSTVIKILSLLTRRGNGSSATHDEDTFDAAGVETTSSSLQLSGRAAMCEDANEA